ncbi:hypothetical protein [Rhizobium leucaenae]|uniref:Uncharacterized protein n=1 Tax=Rhizobium leucaenae TaxID=29450 RepID=A0A7W7ENG5_9HYPH|nr:hypothetical protein [Rhizobium leucaenae]MBB4571604.1 hypothetical protein [Rhizobium leucaenae]MBB6303860.1 hypothetical protein [Rhizobium leucaenae]
MTSDKQNQTAIFAEPEIYIKELVHDQANNLSAIITQVFENQTSTEDVALIRYLLQMLSVATTVERKFH